MSTIRKSAYPIDPIFLNRWSPRSFDATTMPEENLFTILEAARWAPSAFNIQPWRFLYSHRDDGNWQHYLSLLDEFNEGWARHASALIIVISDTLAPSDDPTSQKTSHYNSFDSGAAWAQLALQATTLGYKAHAMAGIHHKVIKESLSIPEQFRVEIAIAIGKQAAPIQLSTDLQEREQPSLRLPMNEIAYAGSFPR
ncbi:MAG: nitroreductase family protein [Sneathiella sp.]